MNDKLILSRAAAIQRYLDRRPASADTAEGIHASWIRSHGEEDSVEVTLAALDFLRIAGVVESNMTGNREIWRRHSTADAVPPVG